MDNEKDIATSNRQRIKEDDERYEQLKEFIQTNLKIISSGRQRFKDKEGKEEALKFKPIKKWFQTLDKNSQKKQKNYLEK